MSNGKTSYYQLDYTPAAKKQIRLIAEDAKEGGQSKAFVRIMKDVVLLMKTDPHGWGDPEYRSKHVDALYCHATRRPVAFRYVIYEQVRGVVLLSVRRYSEFE